MDIDSKLQEIAFEIITNAGEAKASAYEALTAAKGKDRKVYEAKMEEAERSIQLAHNAQFDLLACEAKGELADAKFSILLIHSQDHLMTVMSTLEWIREISELYLNGLPQ